MTSRVMEASADSPVGTVTRLLVTVRDPATRQYRPVGFLSHEDDRFAFAYLRRELARADFRPLPGLARATQGPMHSNGLFPLFAERVISARRPDREFSLNALGLPIDAAPFEVLVRSHGQRVGDTIELLPAPVVAPGGAVSFTFLAHGIRHLPSPNQARITTLVPGEALRLQSDTDNEVNPRALLVTDNEQVRLGWMPDPLIDVVRTIEECSLAVVRANGPDVGYHFRLLARVDGRLAANAQLFSGPEWATVTEPQA